MRKLFAAIALIFVSLAGAQTTIAPGGAIYDNGTGTYLGQVNRNTGAEDKFRTTTGTLLGQVRSAQTTAPTCTTNCGTSPTVTGTDSAMKVLMGATGSPASGWVVTFNGTWAAAPACVAQMSLAGMANTKLPIVVATTTTTITVTTNGAAPANADTYAILCTGVQ